MAAKTRPPGRPAVIKGITSTTAEQSQGTTLRAEGRWEAAREMLQAMIISSDGDQGRRSGARCWAN